jgi:hypothetical protein
LHWTHHLISFLLLPFRQQSQHRQFGHKPAIHLLQVHLLQHFVLLSDHLEQQPFKALVEKHLVLKRLFAFIKGFSLLRGWADDPDALD